MRHHDARSDIKHVVNVLIDGIVVIDAGNARIEHRGHLRRLRSPRELRAGWRGNSRWLRHPPRIDGDAVTTTVETIQARPRRGIELALTVLALAIVIGAWVNVDLALRGDAPAELATVGGGLLALVTGLHLLLRWRRVLC